eukprot:NODE_508_length_6671_cov_0.774041.p3 type:complete len:355 gc:universal NODE_508_length_6671_cov_0.774041:5555-4491(-)
MLFILAIFICIHLQCKSEKYNFLYDFNKNVGMNLRPYIVQFQSDEIPTVSVYKKPGCLNCFGSYIKLATIQINSDEIDEKYSFGQVSDVDAQYETTIHERNFKLKKGNKVVVQCYIQKMLSMQLNWMCASRELADGQYTSSKVIFSPQSENGNSFGKILRLESTDFNSYIEMCSQMPAPNGCVRKKVEFINRISHDDGSTVVSCYSHDFDVRRVQNKEITIPNKLQIYGKKDDYGFEINLDPFGNPVPLLKSLGENHPNQMYAYIGVLSGYNGYGDTGDTTAIYIVINNREYYKIFVNIWSLDNTAFQIGDLIVSGVKDVQFKQMELEIIKKLEFSDEFENAESAAIHSSRQIQ